MAQDIPEAAKLPPVATMPEYARPFTSIVDLGISCMNLKRMDLVSKSDPYVTIYIKNRITNLMSDIGHTEVIKNNSNPQFQETTRIPYFFEQDQVLKFVVEDYNTNGKPDMIGARELRLAEIIVSPIPLMKPIFKPGTNKETGIICINASEVLSAKYEIKFTANGVGLDKKDFMGKSDPYLEIHKPVGDDKTQLIHKTEIIYTNLNPVWQPFFITTNKLCRGDLNMNFEIHCWDWDKDSTDDFIGKTTTSVSALTMPDKSPKQTEHELINYELKEKKGPKYKHSGILKLSCELRELNTFPDYLKGGMEINLQVAIDFTGSNGNPMKADSLHFLGKGTANKYLEVLSSVVSILCPYDTDQRVPCYGFGAKLPRDKFAKPYHLFALNGDEDNPDIVGIENIEAAYAKTLDSCRLSGPTYVSRIIEKVTEAALNSQEGEKNGKQSYQILLLLTDGAFNDLMEVIDLIVTASHLPLSIVIIGIGEDKFEGMHLLDADETTLKDSSGYEAVRDIIQFVSYETVKAKYYPHYFSLAEEVLAEIPRQVEEYMRMRKILPNKPVLPTPPSIYTSETETAQPAEPPMEATPQAN